MRFIGIIPARMASSRFPGKPLALIDGRPMLAHVLDAAEMSEMLDAVFVATPDREIESWCKEARAKCILTDAACRNGTERCHDALRQVAMSDADDIVVNMQADEPLLRGEAIDELCWEMLRGAGIASLYFKPAGPGFLGDPNRVKALVGEGGAAICFTRSALLSYIWPLYGQHIGIYAYRRDLLSELVRLEPAGNLEQVAWMLAGHKIKMLDVGYESVAVDRPADVPAAERLLRDARAIRARRG